jgi:hypothetical protein
MKLKTIDINAKEWFDKINGNSYFSGEITLNYGTKTEKTLSMPFQYGYGNHYVDEAENLLVKNGYIKDIYHCLSRHCRENDIILRTNKKENCKKRDL